MPNFRDLPSGKRLFYTGADKDIAFQQWRGRLAVIRSVVKVPIRVSIVKRCPGKASPESRRKAAEWRKGHPEKCRAYSHRHRALEMNASIGDPKVIMRWESSYRSKRGVLCYWCGGKFQGKKCHTDHIHPLSKGGHHSIENLCISCPSCNHKKKAKTLERWSSEILSPVLL